MNKEDLWAAGGLIVAALGVILLDGLAFYHWGAETGLATVGVEAIVFGLFVFFCVVSEQ